MPSLVERSVIDMGQGSYIITLPKPWVRYLRIKPGDKLLVIINGELVIRPKRRRRRLGIGEESPRPANR